MTEKSIFAAWEADFTAQSKAMYSLFTSLSQHAARIPDLEDQLQKVTDQLQKVTADSTRWQDYFVDTRDELNNKKRELSRKIEGLEQTNAELTSEIESLKLFIERLSAENNALMADRAIQTSVEVVGAPFSVVLIDGDGLIFDRTLLMKGLDGGKEAAQRLLNGTTGFKGATEGAVLNLRVQMFLNKTGLFKALSQAGIGPNAVLECFVIKGFHCAHSSTTLVDVGAGKEAADAKIRDALSFYAKVPNCDLLVLGASHDNGYSTILRSLETEGRLKKVRILKGYHLLARELKEFEDKVIDIPGLFMSDKLNTCTPPVSHPLANAGPPPVELSTFSAVARGATPAVDSFADGPVAVFKGPTTSKTVAERAASTTIPARNMRTLDPKPCHAYYLDDVNGCMFIQCFHSHDYVFTDQELSILADLVKGIACKGWLQDNCRYSHDECIYGHVCPQGRQCTRGVHCYFRKWHEEIRDSRGA